jgi:hypothetical protein
VSIGSEVMKQSPQKFKVPNYGVEMNIQTTSVLTMRSRNQSSDSADDPNLLLSLSLSLPFSPSLSLSPSFPLIFDLIFS